MSILVAECFSFATLLSQIRMEDYQETEEEVFAKLKKAKEKKKKEQSKKDQKGKDSGASASSSEENKKGAVKPKVSLYPRWLCRIILASLNCPPFLCCTIPHPEFPLFSFTSFPLSQINNTDGRLHG